MRAAFQVGEIHLGKSVGVDTPEAEESSPAKVRWCPRQELGQGSWHIPKLNDARASDVAQRYPGLQLGQGLLLWRIQAFRPLFR